MPKPFTHTPALPVKMWKAPRLTKAGKPFTPKPREVGDEITVTVRGEDVTAQVWAAGPYPVTVWAVAGGVAYLVNRNGSILETLDYTRKEVAA